MTHLKSETNENQNFRVLLLGNRISIQKDGEAVNLTKEEMIQELKLCFDMLFDENDYFGLPKEGERRELIIDSEESEDSKEEKKKRNGLNEFFKRKRVKKIENVKELSELGVSSLGDGKFKHVYESGMSGEGTAVTFSKLSEEASVTCNRGKTISIIFYRDGKSVEVSHQEMKKVIACSVESRLIVEEDLFIRKGVEEE